MDGTPEFVDPDESVKGAQGTSEPVLVHRSRYRCLIASKNSDPYFMNIIMNNDPLFIIMNIIIIIIKTIATLILSHE